MEPFRIYDFTADEEGLSEVQKHMERCIALDLGFTVEHIVDDRNYSIIRMSIFATIREITRD